MGRLFDLIHTAHHRPGTSLSTVVQGGLWALIVLAIVLFGVELYIEGLSEPWLGVLAIVDNAVPRLLAGDPADRAVRGSNHRGLRRTLQPVLERQGNLNQIGFALVVPYLRAPGRRVSSATCGHLSARASDRR